MSTNNPMEPLLEQIADLLKLAQENAGKKINDSVDPEILKRLDSLKGFVDDFQNTTLESLKEQGIDPAVTLKKFMEGQGKLTQQNQKILKKTVQLGFDALLMKSALQSASEIGRLGKDFTKELSEKKTSKKGIKERKKKFKRIGGDSKWVPL